MKTIYDFMTIGIFAGLIVLFLQRSIDEAHDDHLWQYLLASVGCAVTNYLGNEGYVVPAVLALVATIAFIVYVLKPIHGFPPRR